MTSTLLVLVGAIELAHCKVDFVQPKLSTDTKALSLRPHNCLLFGENYKCSMEEDPEAAAAKSLRIRPFERLCEHHTTKQCERQAGNQPGLPAERAHRQTPCSAQPPASKPSHCSTAALSRCLRVRGNCYDLMHKVKK